jgi:SagB-type dehydrogenase family enzyme
MNTGRRLAVIIYAVALAVASVPAYCLGSEIRLPAPSMKSKVCVEEAIVAKKSVRQFKSAPLGIAQVSQMLWAANGNIPHDAITGATTKVIPSAGGFYPLEVYLVTGTKTVRGAPAGIYKYDPDKNSLQLLATGDNRKLLAYASLSQMYIADAPAVVVIAAILEKSTTKYGPRGVRYTYMEAGTADQNMYLEAQAIGLHMATVGAFVDEQVAAVLKFPANVKPLLIAPIGR